MLAGRLLKAYLIVPSACSSISSQIGRRPGALAGRPAAGRPDPQPGEPAGHRPLGALAPRHLPPAASARPASFRLTGRGEPSARRAAPRPAAGPAGRPAARAAPSRLLGEDHHLVGDPDDVVQAPLFQAVAERPGDAVAGVGQHHPAGQPLAADLVEQLQGDLALGPRPPLVLGDPGLVQPLRVAQPDLGQVQPHVQRVVALGADVVDR